MAVAGLILELQNNLKNVFHKKNISIWVYFLSFCSKLNGFWVIHENEILSSASNLPVEEIQWKIATGRLETEKRIAFSWITQKPFKLEQKLRRYTQAEIFISSFSIFKIFL